MSYIFEPFPRMGVDVIDVTRLDGPFDVIDVTRLGRSLFAIQEANSSC